MRLRLQLRLLVAKRRKRRVSLTNLARLLIRLSESTRSGMGTGSKRAEIEIGRQIRSHSHTRTCTRTCIRTCTCCRPRSWCRGLCCPTERAEGCYGRSLP